MVVADFGGLNVKCPLQVKIFNIWFPVGGIVRTDSGVGALLEKYVTGNGL